MNAIDFSILLSDVCEEYILEADIYYKNDKQLNKYINYYRHICVAAIILIMFSILPRIYVHLNQSTSLTVNAEEMGEEVYDIGVALPVVAFSDDTKAILYDYRGIYIYNYLSGKLVGFIDFREKDMTRIQGDNPTIVNVTEDGKYVKFYNEEKKYIFDTKNKKVKKVESYINLDKKYNQYEIKSLQLGDEKAICENQITYVLNSGSLLTVTFDYETVDADGVLKYKDLIIIKRTDGKDVAYRLFE